MQLLFTYLLKILEQILKQILEKIIKQKIRQFALRLQGPKLFNSLFIEIQNCWKSYINCEH